MINKDKNRLSLEKLPLILKNKYELQHLRTIDINNINDEDNGKDDSIAIR